jgi:hypothetical protein
MVDAYQLGSGSGPNNTFLEPSMFQPMVTLLKSQQLTSVDVKTLFLLQDRII